MKGRIILGRNRDSFDDSNPNLVSFFIRGYTQKAFQDDLFLNTNLGNFPLHKKKAFFLANWSHARDEYNLASREKISNSISQYFQIFKKTFSIGSSRGRQTEGLCNGVEWSVRVPQDIEFFSLVSSSNTTVHLSRSAARSGVVLDDYSLDLERSARRDTGKNAIFIIDIYSDVKCSMFDYPSLPLKNLLNSFGVQSYLENAIVLGENNVEIDEINVVKQFRDLTITSQGVFLESNSENFSLVDNRDLKQYWPSEIWRNQETKLLMTPTSKGVKSINQAAIYFYCSANWAHFIEDNLPSILELHKKSKDRVMYLGGVVSPIYLETIQSLMPTLRTRVVDSRYSMKFSDVLVNFHQDSRNSLIAGVLSDSPMIDKKSLLQLRNLALSLVADDQLSHKKIFIDRGNRGFRRLINYEEVKGIFQYHGFQTVKFHELGFLDRIKMLRNCSVLAGETGAGMVNGYFCPSNSKVIELRHPSMKFSLEHLPQLDVTGNAYHPIHGQNPSIFQKLRFGSDSYSINPNTLEEVIHGSN